MSLLSLLVFIVVIVVVIIIIIIILAIIVIVTVLVVVVGSVPDVWNLRRQAELETPLEHGRAEARDGRYLGGRGEGRGGGGRWGVARRYGIVLSEPV